MPTVYRSATQWPPVAVTSIWNRLEELDVLLQNQARDPDAIHRADWSAHSLSLTYQKGESRRPSFFLSGSGDSTQICAKI